MGSSTRANKKKTPGNAIDEHMKPFKRTGRAKQNDTDLKNGGKLWTPEQVQCLVELRSTDPPTLYKVIALAVGKTNVACRVRYFKEKPEEAMKAKALAESRKAAKSAIPQPEPTSRATSPSPRRQSTSSPPLRVIAPAPTTPFVSQALPVTQKSVVTQTPEVAQDPVGWRPASGSWGSFRPAEPQAIRPSLTPDSESLGISRSSGASTPMTPAELAAYERGVEEGRRAAAANLTPVKPTLAEPKPSVHMTSDRMDIFRAEQMSYFSEIPKPRARNLLHGPSTTEKAFDAARALANLKTLSIGPLPESAFTSRGTSNAVPPPKE